MLNYGDTITIIKGIFEREKGIIHKDLGNGFCVIEVFFKVPKEHKEGCNDYFDKNQILSYQSTSVLIKIPKSDLHIIDD